MKVATGAYTGNAIDNRSISVGFQPDFVMVNRNTPGTIRHCLSTPGMVSDQTAYYIQTVSFAGGVKAYEADGFKVGTDAAVNANTIAYSWVAMQADANADFKVGTYTGDGNDDRSITGVGFQPDFVLVKKDDTLAGDLGCFSTSSDSADISHTFSTVTKFANGIQSFGADGFVVGNNDKVNANTRKYVYVALKSKTGISKVGTYVGDGGASHGITGIGFQPEMVWAINNTTNGYAPLMKTAQDSGTNSQFFDNSSAYSTTNILSLDADGFSVGANAGTNENGSTFIYIAWNKTADQPPIVTANTNFFMFM